MDSKVMSAQEAVSKFIHDGTTVFIGGFFHAISYAITHEIIRQKKKNLTICQSSFNEHADQLVGAGCIDKIISSYCWMEIFGPLYCFRRAMEKSIPHKIQMEDYSNFAMTVRFLAGALGIPYMPLNSLKGSDMMNYSQWMGDNKVKLREDPFGSGVSHALVPALKPDVGYFHAQQADEEGNVQLWGVLGDAPWSVRACETVIVTVEKIVSRETIGKDPNRTILPAYKVSAVIEEPFAAHPKNTQGFYNVDRDFIFEYIKMSKNEDTWKTFMDEWVYGVANREEYKNKYISKFGLDRFDGLKAMKMQSNSVNYGY